VEFLPKKKGKESQRMRKKEETLTKRGAEVVGILRSIISGTVNEP
jgi:hypothetical protein